MKVMRIKQCLIIFGILQSSSSFDVSDHPVVTTTHGEIQGEIKSSYHGYLYAAFEGIPYAQPPINDLRFEPPAPLEPWEGLKVGQPQPPCLQFPSNAIYTIENVAGVEDCLFLNLYTPTVDENANRDVIVLLYGGPFHGGPLLPLSPSLIMDLNEFVYVTVQYRLGMLGFLSTENDVVPGNMALKDQVMALKWVKNNIQFFGGNPNSITLAGNSGGGVSVQHHMYSPMSEGLFHRAMSLSGTALGSWGVTGHGLEKAQRLAKYVDCDTTDVKDMINCLKSIPGPRLVSEMLKFMKFIYLPLGIFAPVIENEGPNAFITKDPRESISQGPGKDIPYLMSFVETNGNYMASEMRRNESNFIGLDQNWDEHAIAVLGIEYSVPKENQKDVTDAVRQFYFQDKPISMDETYFQLVELFTDRLTSVGVEETIRLHQKEGRAPVYMYKFSYRGLKSTSDFYSQSTENLGASHTDDMYYMFSPPANIVDEGNGIIDLMLGMVSSFAKTGKPSAGEVDWVPACCTEDDEINYLYIKDGSDHEIKHDKAVSNLEFWKSLKINDY